MVRQKQRKSVEELYAAKFEGTTTKSQVNGNIMTRNMRSSTAAAGGIVDYGGYINTTNTAHNANCLAAPNSSMTTGRRKSVRPTPLKSEKYCIKDEKILNLDDVKKEQNAKSKTSRPADKYNFNSPNICDNKNYVNFTETNPAPKEHHHRHESNHDDDKDDDTEEFFELIRHTVENAIGKSISDLLNRNFRELSAKVERFSAELNQTNALLNKFQTEMNNKVVHYGEENSRHFRYLCMKSEYDKMFYQHHTMLATNSSTENNCGLPKPTSHASKPCTPTPPPPTPSTDCETMKNPCSCRSNSKTTAKEPHKSSSDDHSLSNKSSEVGMREVLEHIQRFCTQMQLNDLKCDDRGGKFRKDDVMKINQQIFENDDDEFQMSSDGMTPRSDDRNMHAYGGTTLRGASSKHGGGDA